MNISHMQFYIVGSYGDDEEFHYVHVGTELPEELECLVDNHYGVHVVTEDVAEAAYSLFLVEDTNELVVMPITIDGPHQLNGEEGVIELGFLMPLANVE